MLFVSERQKDVTVRNEKLVFSPASGEKIGIVRRVAAKMERGYIPAWALPIVLDTFSMGGKPPSVPPHRWLASYDSALAQKQFGWTDDERALIEAKLLAQGDVVMLTQPKLEAPYARYDLHRKLAGRRVLEHVLKDIQDAYEGAGFDIDKAVAYERQNLNDPAVIDMLEGLRPFKEIEIESLIAT